MYAKPALLTVVMLVSRLNAAGLALSDEVEVFFDKAEYLPGEPILLKTVVTNLDGKNLVGELDSGGRQGFYCLGGYFSLHLARNGSDFRDILGKGTARPEFFVAVPPVHLDYWRDSQCIPSTLKVGESRERVDMIVLQETGVYFVKAVLKNKDGTVRFASSPAELRVVPFLVKAEGLAGLAEEAAFVELGRAICSCFYERMDSYLTDNETCRSLAEKLIQAFPDSRFSTFVDVSHTLAHAGGSADPHVLSPAQKQAAERFLADHPSSWLLPELGRRLFWAYVSDGDRPSAEHVMAKALESGPNATVLRDVRQLGQAKLNQIAPALRSPPPATSTSPLWPIVLVAAVAVTVALVILGVARRTDGKAGHRGPGVRA